MDYITLINSNLENLVKIVENYNIKIKQMKKGYYHGNCPFHNDKTPSFGLYEKNGKARFKCQSCGAKGDAIDFIQKYTGLGKNEAIKEACQILGIENDDQPSKIEKFINFIKNNSKLNGYNYENTYIYRDEDGNPIFLKNKYRSIEDPTKKTFITKGIIETENGYRYLKNELGESFDKIEKYIYNYPKIKKAIENNQNIYIVEGEKDADNLNRLGLAATTIYSKHWEKSYTNQLEGAKIVFIGDTGQAGEQFKKLFWKNLKNKVKTFRVVNLTGIEKLGDNKDVTDWLELGHTKEDLIECIKNSWDWKISTQWKDVRIKYKNDEIEEIKPLKTIDNFRLILQRNKTELFFNEISKEIEIKTKKFKNKNLNTFATELQTEAIKEGLNCSRDDVTSWINAIAYENSINPFKEYLDNLKDKWDGKSRLKEFFDCFKTVEFFNEELKEKIFRYWLLQFLDSAYNPEFASQGILVLKGSQGMGKTTSMKNLIPIKEKWVFLREQKFEDSRDGIQKITSNQLVELSEFARSNKQVDALKGFVTSPVDKLVLKYDKYPTDYKRKTIFYATVNDAEFLLDDENRRFWIIDLTSIDLQKIEKFDFNQLWAELYYIYHVENNKKCYFDKEELIELEESNQNYKFKGELESQIEITFDFNRPQRIWLTTPEVIQFIGKLYSATKVSRTLKSMKIEQKIIENKNLPRNKYNKMPLPKFWNGKVKQQYINRVANFKVVENQNSNLNNNKELQDQIKKLEMKIDLYKKEVEKLLNENNELKNKNKELNELCNFLEKEYNAAN